MAEKHAPNTLRSSGGGEETLAKVALAERGTVTWPADRHWLDASGCAVQPHIDVKGVAVLGWRGGRWRNWAHKVLILLPHTQPTCCLLLQTTPAHTPNQSLVCIVLQDVKRSSSCLGNILSLSSQRLQLALCGLWPLWPL